MSENIIEVADVSFRYDRDDVLEHINLDVPKGAFLGIVGPNGSGKSTLLKLMLGLLKPQAGEIRLFGKPLARFKDWSRIGFVSQKANSFNTGYPATVLEVVASGLATKTGLFRFMGSESRKDAIEAIRSVGMEDYLHQNIGELSGGQQQRVFIARAIVSKPEILILDEPTVGVDHQHVQSFYEMMEILNQQLGITLILVTHDIGAITSNVTHVACLNKHLYFHGEREKFEELDDAEVSSWYHHDIQLLSHEHELEGV
ncbi:metal ABC transporter ATP-binding protein [Heyndrickxia acidiproducens]|uniref:metal ABC transporter ATP-binding protein n=1 Tax=Heyndrickxia acidiproducens TaxID=1121084 RepID=UPI00037DC13D|nr:metal ABC transporter ATP-binding protein [Heyndrickxia acidiproducens]